MARPWTFSISPGLFSFTARVLLRTAAKSAVYLIQHTPLLFTTTSFTHSFAMMRELHEAPPDDTTIDRSGDALRPAEAQAPLSEPQHPLDDGDHDQGIRLLSSTLLMVALEQNDTLPFGAVSSPPSCPNETTTFITTTNASDPVPTTTGRAKVISTPHSTITPAEVDQEHSDDQGQAAEKESSPPDPGRLVASSLLELRGDEEHASTPPGTTDSPPATAVIQSPSSIQKNIKRRHPSPARWEESTATMDGPAILRRGDLVRVSERGKRSAKRLKDREGQLGRILQCVPIPPDDHEQNHDHKSDDMVHTQDNDPEGAPGQASSYLYDVEWILGGKLTGVRREELLYTTAAQEGLTDDTSVGGTEGLMRVGRRTKRKPCNFMDENLDRPTNKRKKSSGLEAVEEGAKESSASAAKGIKNTKGTNNKLKERRDKPETATGVTNIGRATSKKSSNCVISSSNDNIIKSTKTKVVKSTAAKAKALAAKGKVKVVNGKQPQAATSTTPAAASSTKGRKRKLDEGKQIASAAPSKDTSSGPGYTVMDLYERHRREFERIFARLEKLDRFGYMKDAAPPEFDEQYGLVKTRLAVEMVEQVSTEPASPPHVDSAELESSPTKTELSAHQEGLSSLQNNISDQVTGRQPGRDSAAATPPLQHSSMKKKKKHSPSKEPQPTFPSYPPYNWEMIRRRMDQGRYVVDREILEENHRFELFKPYYNTLDRKARPKRRRGKEDKKANSRVLNKFGVDWDLFRFDVIGMCDAAIARDESDPDSTGLLSRSVVKVKEAVEQAYDRTGRRQMAEMATTDDRYKFAQAIQQHDNAEAAMQSWRKVPYPERKYERLSSDVVCDGLSDLDKRIALYELKTNLPDSFVGLSYRYDDTGQSEAWMKSVVDETGSRGKKRRSSIGPDDDERKAAQALAADQGVIRAQVLATMQSLLIQVQDQVMTDQNVLHQPELRSANWLSASDSSEPTSSIAPASNLNPEVVEQPVWGIDCYTRRNVLLCLETEFDPKTALLFVEKWLLIAINACPVDLAHDLLGAARLLEGLPIRSNISNPEGAVLESSDENVHWTRSLLGRALEEKIRTSAPPWMKLAANQLRRAREALGPDFFRVHPKGHGSVVLTAKVPPNSLVTFYRGEVYPSWRWGEKMDAIELIQKRKGLKPALPDFYNMALERPQRDPRGYGLLLVDASRKAGHGSALSHSCIPTCEVRVAALNGELCLAMTTLREIEMGEELTFDYNAVTESLEEYRAAICLCGYGKCRGSFLHFATADCYQQVLNRNAPIATRFSNLIKGCMKKVMSEDDERVLRSHGFGSAAFGAISINRRNELGNSFNDQLMDSLELVPVWLRTYVADALRYIEYERRALPIALICDHLSSLESSDESESVRPSKEPKLEPTFFYFARNQAAAFTEALKKEGFPGSGLQLRHAVQKMAANFWQELDEAEKLKWKEAARVDYEERVKLWGGECKGSKEANGQNGRKQLLTDAPKQPKERPDLSSKLSFEDADAEGISAMEQRIQQLTQTLSRVGRVLDRQREASFIAQDDHGSSVDESVESLCRRVGPPLRILSDADVIGWMWNYEEGVARTLIRCVENSSCCSPRLLDKLKEIRSTHDSLEAYGSPVGCHASSSETINCEGDAVCSRHQLKTALLAMRSAILRELKVLAKQFRESKSLPPIKREESPPDTSCVHTVALGHTTSAADLDQDPSATISTILDELISEIVAHSVIAGEAGIVVAEPPRNPWLEQYAMRFVLQAAADLLLFFAYTSNFFMLSPTKTLTSTPLAVYARELGNAVPRSAMDVPLEHTTHTCDEDVNREGKRLATQPEEVCRPDDIIAEVTVEYKGDYVLSQLLQWYNGGIGQKPGLPDLMGCVQLPEISGCWASDLVGSARRKADRKTAYEAKIRPRLVEWLQDPFQRGSPWPREVQQAFVATGDEECLPRTQGWVIFGSPVVDFLVSGDEENIFDTLEALDSEDKVVLNGKSNNLLQSVDKGRPAQAVSTWVQCENPECMKWRKIPWHVDVDLLPEVFFCKDNKWDPNANSCEAAEDDWDEADLRVGADGKVEGSPVRRKRNELSSPNDEKSFFVGARFDVLKEDKGKFFIARVVKVDFSGIVKRIKFHFSKFSQKYDEWIEFGSHRIQTLFSKVTRPSKSAKGRVDVKADVEKDVLDDSGVYSAEKGETLNEQPVSGSCWKEDKDKNCRNDATLVPCSETSLTVGARFDVLRHGKDKFCVGVVEQIDFDSDVKRIKFHFPKLNTKFDEWIEFGSFRIRPLPKDSKPAKSAKVVENEKSCEENNARAFDHNPPVKAVRVKACSKNKKGEVLSPNDEESFTVGARFDVLRQSKNKFFVAVVKEVDFADTSKRVLFHYLKVDSKLDEWIEFGSPRIQPLFSKVQKASKTTKLIMSTHEGCRNDGAHENIVKAGSEVALQAELPQHVLDDLATIKKEGNLATAVDPVLHKTETEPSVLPSPANRGTPDMHKHASQVEKEQMIGTTERASNIYGADTSGGANRSFSSLNTTVQSKSWHGPENQLQPLQQEQHQQRQQSLQHQQHQQQQYQQRQLHQQQQQHVLSNDFLLSASLEPPSDGSIITALLSLSQPSMQDSGFLAGVPQQVQQREPTQMYQTQYQQQHQHPNGLIDHTGSFRSQRPSQPQSNGLYHGYPFTDQLQQQFLPQQPPYPPNGSFTRTTNGQTPYEAFWDQYMKGVQR